MKIDRNSSGKLLKTQSEVVYYSMKKKMFSTQTSTHIYVRHAPGDGEKQ